jgi:hypothetical protein
MIVDNFWENDYNEIITENRIPENPANPPI